MSADASNSEGSPVANRPDGHARHELLFVSILALTVLGLTAGTLGLWEPWESDHLNVVLNMLTHGNWLEVSSTYSGTAAPSELTAALPYSWWPIAASIALFGENEFALRAPYVLLMFGCSIGLFWLTAKLWGRRAAWFTFAIALSMPLFVVHRRFALGAAATMQWSTLAVLAIVAHGFGYLHRFGLLLIGFLTAAAGLSGGLPGLAIPIMVGLTFVFSAENWRSAPHGRLLGTLLVSAAVAGGGWWLAWQPVSDTGHLAALILWPSGLDGLGTTSRPAFNGFVHQIGIGLFPFGALLPLAFCELFYPSESNRGPANRFGVVLIAWFAVSFLGPALGATYSHYAIFLGAPAAAAALGIYFHRLIASPPRPIFALASVLLIALIDSNLKHNTQLLADTLIGGQVDSFPPKLAFWPVARILNFAFIGVILVYQGGLHRWCAQHLGRIAYPRQIRAKLDGWLVLVTAPAPLLLWAKSSHLDTVIRAGFWHPLKPSVRRFIAGLAAWVLVYVVVRLAINARVQLLQGRHSGRLQARLNNVVALLDGHQVKTQIDALIKPILFPPAASFFSARRSLMVGLVALIFALTMSLSSSAFNTTLVTFSKLGVPTAALLLKNVPAVVQPLIWLIGLAAGGLAYILLSGYLAARSRHIGQNLALALERGMQWVGEKLENLGVAQVAFGLIFGLWVIFFKGPSAHALTTTFTQKEIVDRFQALADDDETVFRYRLKSEHRSFYTHRLPELNQREFGRLSREKQRFFAIIPRKDLATVNRQFRQVTQRTLPVLYDASARYLLVSNQLVEGEQDRNPITRALVKALPKWATPVQVNFDDAIELIGWRMDPRRVRPGGSMTLHLFWRALKNQVGQWKIFAHIDAPGQRIHGDHYPVEGLFPTQNWREGDIIHDVHRMKVKRTISPATFTVYAGWYQGQKRLPIKSGPKDKDNRARLGSIRVQ
ncbi:MAG: hypothetical protein VX589_08540 [Myxococcota bacterium]|nr:hypothetical protein [Myxococcota bacterium]